MSKWCTCCKQNKPIGDFHKNGHRKDGLQVACKACRSIVNKIKYSPMPKEFLRMHRRHAKQRGIITHLELADFENAVGKPCAYCGCEMKRISFDRKNNDRGYYRDNIAVSCRSCNSSKSTRSYEEFTKELACHA